MDIAVCMRGDLMQLNGKMCKSYSDKLTGISKEYSTKGDSVTAIAYGEKASVLKNIVKLMDKHKPSDIQSRVMFYYTSKQMLEMNANVCLIFRDSLEETMKGNKDLIKKNKLNIKRVQSIIKLLGSSVKISEEIFV